MNSEEILTCLIFVIIGYFVAMMFSKCNCNGFRVGTAPAQLAVNCKKICSLNSEDNCNLCIDTESVVDDDGNKERCDWNDELGECTGISGNI